MITAAREAVDLLVQAGNTWHFGGTRQGSRDRYWMALRFLARANRFSRTPSALAKFIGVTRATVSQMVKELEGRGYLERRRSPQDKRSVTIAVRKNRQVNSSGVLPAASRGFSVRKMQSPHVSA